MPVTGVAAAYAAIGGIVAYSGIKGTSLTVTARGLLSGKLNQPQNEPILTAQSSVAAGNVTSGNANQNYLTVAKFLVGNGYTPAAAAGICGCIAGESAGNPEAIGAGSYGLIQEQGQQYKGLVTGNPSADLSTQMQAIITYNNAQGAGLIAMLNSISDPVKAADFYSAQFERPAIMYSDVVPSVARSVYAALTGGG
jgi:hypothetical protein